MGVTNRLVFDPTDAGSIAASSSMGAYVRAGSDGDLIASQTIAGEEWLNTASSLFAADGTPLTETGGSLDVNITGAPGLGIYAEDSAHTTADDGQYILGVRQDSLASSVSADGDYGSIKFNAKGELYTIDTDGNALLTTIDGDTGNIASDTAAMVVDLAAIEVEQLAQGVTLDSILADTATIDSNLASLTHAEDAAHVSGDSGVMGLAVRNDAGTSMVSADGDYAPLQVDATGRLRVVTAVDIDDDLANVAIQNTATAVSLTAVNVVTSSLANRKWLYLANEGNKSLYFGKTGVTTANGFPMHSGQQSEFRIGPAVTPQIIGGTGASAEDLRVMELS